ncbi:hypothetical protein H4582DRAFT_1920134 [Lactarius indigo]|nr:hypothetical protein H4582DRAFT_1920134 [Lactarius indigo]
MLTKRWQRNRDHYLVSPLFVLLTANRAVTESISGDFGPSKESEISTFEGEEVWEVPLRVSANVLPLAFPFRIAPGETALRCFDRRPSTLTIRSQLKIAMVAPRNLFTYLASCLDPFLA